jgi:hypothetical protein
VPRSEDSKKIFLNMPPTTSKAKRIWPGIFKDIPRLVLGRSQHQQSNLILEGRPIQPCWHTLQHSNMVFKTL